MTDTAELFIDSRCELGEGPLWHPLQNRLFWFDILNKTLFSATDTGTLVDRFIFDMPVTAAAVIDSDTLAVAAQDGIYRLHLAKDTRELIAPLEADTPGNRSNDGRVDPSGGFWIGTMSLRDADKTPAGALYQVKNGQVTPILSDVRVSNAICFSPDGLTAYFADTPTNVIRKVAIDRDTGLPTGTWSDFARIEDGGHPDGAIIDAEGFMWNARWGAGSVVRISPEGRVDRVVKVPGASQVTCPSLGGKDLKTLFITTARENMTEEQLASEPSAGSVFAIDVDVPGQTENLAKL